MHPENHYVSDKPNTVLKIHFSYANIPNPALLKRVFRTRSAIKSEVTLFPMRSCCVRSRLLSHELESQIGLCADVCAIAGEHKTIKPLQISPNYI